MINLNTLDLETRHELFWKIKVAVLFYDAEFKYFGKEVSVTGWDLVVNTANDRKQSTFVRTVAIKGILDAMTTPDMVKCLVHAIETQKED